MKPTTVRVITKKPDPLLPVRMAQMGSQILPARLTTDDGVKELARRPVGSGAYRFVEWVKDERLVMEANRDWWGWEGKAPGDRPRGLEADPRRLPPAGRPREGRRRHHHQRAARPHQVHRGGPEHAGPDRAVLRIVEFNINSTQPPLADKRVRQAMHYALDVHAIIRNLYAGHGKPMAGALADTDFGYNPAIKPYPYDPAKAERSSARRASPAGSTSRLHAGMARWSTTSSSSR